MFLRRSFFALLLYLPLFLAAWGIGYLYAATAGQTWEGTALAWMLRLSLALHGMLYLWAFSIRSWRGLQVNVVFSILLALVIAFDILSSFPGTGSRYGNLGLDWLGGIALGNLFVLVPIGLCRVPSHTWPMLAAALLTFPLTYGAAHRALALPLERALDGIELAQVCVVQQEPHDTDWANATPVRSPDQLDLGWIIGEPSPRVSLWQDGTLLRWRYGKSRFEQIGTDTQRPAACVRP